MARNEYAQPEPSIQNRTPRQLNEPVRRAADQPVIERGMTHITDNQKVEMMQFDKFDNGRHGMTCNDMGRKFDTF